MRHLLDRFTWPDPGTRILMLCTRIELDGWIWRIEMVGEIIYLFGDPIRRFPGCSEDSLSCSCYWPDGAGPLLAMYICLLQSSIICSMECWVTFLLNPLVKQSRSRLPWTRSNRLRRGSAPLLTLYGCYYF